MVRADHAAKFKMVDPGGLAHRRPELKIGVAVDGSKISQRAFDRALGFASKADVVEAFHVHDGSTNRRMEPEYQLKNLQVLYESECNKALAVKRVRACSFTPMLKHGSTSAPARISEHVEHAKYDLLVLGSIELADVSKNIHLGSVAAACAKGTSSNICVVKNFVSYQ
jgi:nucleotide-binding universal stress UspA family protein